MTLTESREAIAHFTQEYEKLRAKHRALPSADKFNEEFDIFEHISRERLFPHNILRYCRWAMMQAINAWMGYLHGFLIPNPQSAASMEEYNFLDDAEKRKVVDVLNWHMYRTRELNELQLYEDDGRTAAFIITVFKEWRTHKEFLAEILSKTKDAWKERCEKHARP
jgi:hypothetical protein